MLAAGLGMLFFYTMMEIKIVFNNESVDERFLSGWGFSCLVDNRILFDTGEKAEYLFNNMKNMDINLSSVEAVVISHDHWDHTGGLWGLLEKKQKIKVYVCSRFSRAFKDKVKKLQGRLIEIEKFAEIEKNIFITGEIPGIYKGVSLPEQALAVKTDKGIIVITGCAHPGIIKILEAVKKKFPEKKIWFVFGGFHLINKDKREIKIIVERFKELGVEMAGPAHCTGYNAQMIFKKEYADNYISVKAGQTFEI